MRPELQDIKKQLADKGRPTKPQTAYLLDALTRNEDGESLDDAFNNAVMPESGRGKQSVTYRSAKKARDARLKEAFGLLDGKDWGRCYKLASLVYEVQAKLKDGSYPLDSEIERLIVRAIKTGVRVPTDAKRIRAAIFPD